MSIFKVGEKIVFVPIIDNKNIWTINTPKKHEIVTVAGYCVVHKNSLDIKEYLYDIDGVRQSINARHFQKLDYDFAENLLAEIKEQVQSEYQLN